MARKHRFAVKAGKKVKRTSTALALAVGLTLAFPGSAALAEGKPIPGVHVVPGDFDGDGVEPGKAAPKKVSKGKRSDDNLPSFKIGENESPRPTNRGINVTPVNDPPGKAADPVQPAVFIGLFVRKAGEKPVEYLRADASGGFSGQLTGPGDYTVSTDCRQTCPLHSVSGTLLKPGDDAAPPVIGILIGLLLPAQKAGADAAPASFNFTIKQARTVVLSGKLPSQGSISLGEIAIKEAGTEDLSGPTRSQGKVFPKVEIDEKYLNIPTAGTEVRLEHDPSGIVSVSARTDTNGAYEFTGLPAGNYMVSLFGQEPKSLTVGSDGIVAGKVMRGRDGNMTIFDRWGNSVAAPKPGDEKPDGRRNNRQAIGGFGTGIGAGPGTLLGPSIGAGSAMGPGGLTGPGSPMGAGGPMGPGSAMGTGGSMGPGPAMNPGGAMGGAGAR